MICGSGRRAATTTATESLTGSWHHRRALCARTHTLLRLHGSRNILVSAAQAYRTPGSPFLEAVDDCGDYIECDSMWPPQRIGYEGVIVLLL